MKLPSLFAFVGLAAVATSTSTTMDMSGTETTMDMSSSASAAASTSVDNSPEYTITANPAVQSAPACVFNCLIPIGLADPSGCDNVTENCACLSAPADVLGVLTDCINTVCTASTSAYGASATSLYESYCQSVYGNVTFSQAFVAESSADAAAAASSSSASVASVEATMTSSSSSKATSASGSSSASSTAKSGSSIWLPSLITVGMVAMGGFAFLVIL